MVFVKSQQLKKCLSYSKSKLIFLYLILESLKKCLISVDDFCEILTVTYIKNV